MQTECKHCHQALPEIALANKVDVIICEHCHAVNYMGLGEIRIPDSEDEDIAPLSEYPEKLKAKPKQVTRRYAENITIQRIPQGFEITYVWLNFMHLLVAASVFVSAMLFLWFVFHMDWQGTELDLVAWNVAIAFGLLAVGYYVLVSYVNKTSIKIFEDEIDISHGPLPALGKTNHTIERSDILQVYCKRRRIHTSRYEIYNYDVHYITKNGTDFRLMSGFPFLPQALFIEQQIERLYQIHDKPVYDEYPPKKRR